MLRIDNLCAGYVAGQPAVRGVDLRLASGEKLGLVGESGSGKSTIAKVLLGVLPDNAWATGSATFDGAELVGRDEPDWRGLRGQRVGVVPQGAMGGLNPVTRVEHQLVEAVRLHTNSSTHTATARAAELVGMVHLDSSVLRAYPHQLSGGMRQRVGIALAVAGEPELIVADEPTTGLDLLTQERILNLLAELCDGQGMALLVISHDLPGVLTLVDRIAVMYGGRIVESRAATGIRGECAHPYTKGLLSASASVVPDAMWSAIPGSPPPIDKNETGCRFAPRCPIATEGCREVEPTLIRRGAGEVACHRVAERITPSFPAVPHLAASNGAEPVVEASGVEVSFRGRGRTTHALRGVDLSIGRGEVLGLVGESGSGKTTLGRVLLGLVRPDSGRASIAGAEITSLRGRHLRTAQRRVGFVHQDPYGSLHPAMDVRSLVAEPLTLSGVPRDQRMPRIVRALEEAGLPTDRGFWGRLPAKLSGGQRQRVAIARALVTDPVLLVADEATSMLDVSTRAGIATALRRLAAERGLAVLFVTHDLGEAMHACDRVQVLRQGVVVEAGSPQQIYNEPEQSYTTHLIAAGRRRTVRTERGEHGPAPTS